jgi:hypothetical protein
MTLMIPGFVNLADVYNKRVSEVGVPVVNEAQRIYFAEHNRQMQTAMNLFVTRTTQYKTMYRSIINTRNQPLDEHGRALPVKGGDKYPLELPIQGSGNAWGKNWFAGEKMTVQEAAEDAEAIVNGDIHWNFDHILASIYTNTSGGWDWYDDEHGAQKISPLANGDSVVYSLFSGASSGATDNHYLAQANAISDTDDPFDEIFEELAEHPENGQNTQVIAFIPTGLKAAVMQLEGFHKLADPNVRVGANNDELVGQIGAAVPGTVIGYHDSGVWIVEWRRLTANYIIAVATGGGRPIAMREHEESSLQGFIQIPGPGGVTREDYPFYEQQWARFAGYGGWNRVGALVYRIGNASYAIPSNFTAPIN